MRSIGIGAWGEDVTTLQEILNELGYPVKIDGIFGTETRNMVLNFQENNTDSSGAPLVVDGIVGPKTWWALTHVGVFLSPAPRGKSNVLGLLSGYDVTTIQTILNNLGYPVIIDGIFGPQTRTAVMKFQENNTDDSGAPLVVDGIVGPKTWWALTHTGTVPGSITPTPAPGAKSNTLALIGIAAALLGGYLLFTSK